MATVYTQTGEELVVDILDGTTAVPTYYIAWGTGTNAAVKGDTGLQTPSAEARVSTTNSQPSADINQFVATITSSGAQTITEAGLFNSSTAGTLIVRGDFAGIALGNGDSIQFTITLEQT